MTVLAEILDTGAWTLPDWADRVRALPRPEQHALLARANRVREGEPEDRAFALACYTALHDQVDPGDAELMAWMVRQKPDANPRLEMLFRMTLELTTPGPARWAAGVLLGRFAKDTGRHEGAERHYCDVLRESKGTGHRMWRGACVNLSQLYREHERYVESLALARRAEADAEASEDLLIVALSRQNIVAAFSDLEDLERLEPALDRFEESLALVSPERHGFLYRIYLGYRSTLRLLQGDLDGALEDIEIVERTPSASSPTFIAVCQVYRAELLRRKGRFFDARLLVETARGAIVARDRLSFAADMESLRLALAMEGPGAVRESAHAVLDGLAGAGAAVGHGARLKFAAELGALLRDRCGAAEDARRAFEIAAEAAAACLTDLDRFVLLLPQLAASETGDMELLVEYRERLWKEQAAMRSAAELDARS